MTHRLMLEAREHDVNCFATLTIRKECLPVHGESVSVREAQDFLKRLRVAKLPRGESRRFRYYLVGEYGDLTGRAHYHLALFGFADLGLLAFSWPYGRVQLDELNEKTAAYICGYVAEKAAPDAERRTAGRAPEFARMSLGTRGEGGLGAAQAERIARAIGEQDGALPEMVDVPAVLNIGGKSWPLGRYLQGRARQVAGLGGRKSAEAQRVGAAKLLSEVDAFGSTTKYVEWKEKRREHDAVKAKQKFRQSSKRMKGTLSEKD